MIEIGKIYRHYKKGDKYKVLHIVKNSETQEDMVVYQALYGDNQLWVRPVSIWEDSISDDKLTNYGQSIRFKKDYLKWWELEDIAL